MSRIELCHYLPQTQSWKGEEDHFAPRVFSAACNYLDTLAKDDNFLLWVDSFDPHEPWDPPSVYDSELKCPYDPKYDGQDIIDPVPTFVDTYLTEEELHHIQMLYAEKITMVDRWFGKFIEKLKEKEMFDESLIIFISDHGEPLGNDEHGHGIIRKCRPWPYEELSHVPLIIHHPDNTQKRISPLVETVDIMPTILDFFKLKIKKRIQGKSLLPIILGETEKVKDFAISGYFGFSWSIITDKWSYFHWLEQKQIDDPTKLLSL
ncbi:MAG: sulfatase-like hydrolase/transferase, partial [Candidatus Helarchaeota archaeon]